MTNIPILYRNIMDGLPCEFSRDVFLWAAGRFDNDPCLYRAEKFARDVAKASNVISDLISLRQRVTLRDGGLLMDEDQEADLMRFFRARMANMAGAGNAAPEWVG